MAEAAAGAMSRSLRRTVAGLDQQHAELAQRIVRLLRSELPEYFPEAEAAGEGAAPRQVLAYVRLWYGLLMLGRMPAAPDLEALTALGRERARRGVSLADSLRAHHLIIRGHLDALLQAVDDDEELHREILFSVSPQLLAFSDLVGRSISEAYAGGQGAQAGWRDRLRGELCQIIFERPGEIEPFREGARALGLDPDLPCVGLALHFAKGVEPNAVLETQLPDILTAAGAAFDCGRDRFFHALRHGKLCLWFSPRSADFTNRRERWLTERAEAMLDALPSVVCAGIGLPDHGPEGWQRTIEQAIAAADMGRRLSPMAAAHQYADFALDEVTGQSRNVAEFFRGLVERLSAEPQLLETLEAYFRHGLRHKAVAAALKIHRNTLVYRLERIEALLGASLDDVGWLAKLHVALRQHRLGGGRRSR